MKSAASVLALFLVAAAPRTADTRSVAVNQGIPKLRAGEIWIGSIPSGLEVRLGDQPEAKLVGRTPLVIDAPVRPTHVTVILHKKEAESWLPGQMDLMDFTAHTTHSMTVGSQDIARAITYRFEQGGRPTAVALFQPRSGTLSDWARRYPAGKNFRFSDEPVRRGLTEKKIPGAFQGLAIELLHRGGKVALPGANGWVIAQVTPSGRVELTDAPK